MENNDIQKLKPQQELPAENAPDPKENVELCEGCERMRENFRAAPNNNDGDMNMADQCDEAAAEAATKFESGNRGL